MQSKMLTHDVCAPLANIKIILDLLETGMYGDLNESGKRAVNTAQYAASRVLSMLRDLLSLDRLESNELPLASSEIAFGILCNTAINLVNASAEKAGLAIEVQNPETIIFGDPELVTRLLTNLLSNAIKSSEPGQKIKMRAEHTGNWTEIRISDQGRGIPMEKLAVIFNSYQQVQPSDSWLQKGSGLGLTICKAIVAAHGGTIGVESQPGKGSTFLIRLPVSSGQLPTAIPQYHP